MSEFPLVTLTTDFGTQDSYVAQMKGVMFSLAPQLKLIDLSHEIPAQNLSHAASFIAEACPKFPAGSIHVVVVDPGVGTDRHILLAEVGQQRFVCPDNGVLTELIQQNSAMAFHRLNNAANLFKHVSCTFHGRDLMGPAAIHWANGLSLEEFAVPVERVTLLDLPQPVCGTVHCEGVVTGSDSFGNVLTNVHRGDLARVSSRPPQSLTVGDYQITEWVNTYGEAKPGRVVALIGSSERLEIAIVNGNAARSLNLKPDMQVKVQW